MNNLEHWLFATLPKLIEFVRDAPGQLYNLATDPGETKNLYFTHPEIAKELKTLLEASKASGRTATTKPQP
jgi:hypothetical protein